MNINKIAESITRYVAPVIITYNRSKHLNATLDAFFNGGFSTSVVHVLDNASTDETKQVVLDWQKKWPSLKYHKNPYNIGGNANILKSVEIGGAPYHWVIGDDDQWQFDQETLQELLEVLAAGKADVIRLGWLVPASSHGKLIDAKQLVTKESFFYASLSMISSVILKREMIAQYLPLAFQGVVDSYPQLIAPIRAIEEKEEKQDLQVYSLKANLIAHVPSQDAGYFYGDLEWYSCWFRLSRFIDCKKRKKYFVAENLRYMCRDNPGRIKEWAWLLKVLLYYKSFKLNQWPYLLAMLTYGAGRRIDVIMLILTSSLLPTWLLVLLRKIYLKIKKTPEKTARADRSRL